MEKSKISTCTDLPAIKKTLQEKLKEKKLLHPLDKKTVIALSQSILKQVSSPEIKKKGVTNKDIELICEKVASNIKEQQSGPPLTYMEVYITDDCNLRCDYCFIKKKNIHHKMTKDTAKATIDFFIKESRNEEEIRLLLFGGEPLIAFDIAKYILEYAEKVTAGSRKKIAFDATTNGTLITEEVMKFSQNNRIKYLFSLDGDEKSHNKHRRTVNNGDSFQMITNNIPLVKKYQPWLGTRLTITPETVAKLTDNVKYLCQLGINQFILGPATGEVWAKETLQIYERELFKLADFYIQSVEKKSPLRINFFEKPDGSSSFFNKKTIWGCQAGLFAVTISTQGNIFPCSRLYGLTSGDESIGNMGNVYKGFTPDSKVRAEWIDHTDRRRPKCRECEAKDYCTGGCPAENYAATGSIFEPAESGCLTTKVEARVLRKLENEVSFFKNSVGPAKSKTSSDTTSKENVNKKEC